MQNQGKNESVSIFSANSIAHILRIIKKKYVSKKYHVFHSPHKPANQEVNFDVISYVMTFLTLRVKVRQCIVSKDHISMNNGDNFIKIAG